MQSFDDEGICNNAMIRVVALQHVPDFPNLGRALPTLPKLLTWNCFHTGPDFIRSSPPILYKGGGDKIPAAWGLKIYTPTPLP